jgi:autotransporter-associated beta strand protein
MTSNQKFPMKTSVFIAPTCVLLGAAANAQVTSVASAAWDAGTTWSDGLAPTSPSTYSIDGENVNTPNLTANGTRTFTGAGLSISSGRLDLKVEHSGSVTAANFSIPGISLSGGALRSDASTGNSTLVLQSPLTVSGTSSIEVRDGSFTNSLSLSQGLSGSGLIQFSSDRSGNSGTGERAHLRVLGAANAYSGNWTVRGFDVTGEHANLWADAAGSLGTGSVELLQNGRLINQVAGGIDTLTGVSLTGTGALVSLVQPWIKPAATLVVNAGRVDLGSATSEIGSLSGTGGGIQGTGVASALTVNQTTHATYAGSLGFSAGNALSFTKAGAANLTLTGTIDPAVPLTLNDGGLGIGAATVASLTQNGGTFQLGLGSAPTVTGNYARTAGDISVQVSSPPALGTPYTVLSYQGTLTSNPPVTVGGVGGSRLTPAVNYGTGSNSTISVTFSGTAASLTWRGTPSGAWDVNTSSNWTNGGSPDKYFQYDHVSFTDAASGTTNVALNDTVTPGSVTFDHSSKNYTISGTGGISGVTTLTKSGTGTLTLETNNPYTGDTVINAGLVQVGTGGTSGSLGTGAVINDGTLSFNRSDSATIANLISGAGSLSQTGAGTTILTADNTYTGATTVSAGTLQVGNGGATGSLGDTSAVTNSGTLAFNRTGTFTITPEITGSGSLLQSGPGTVVLAAGAGHTGGTTIAGGTLVVGTGGTTGSITGPVTNNGTFALNRSDDLDFANVISGSGSFDHRGVGTLRLTGANTYAGTTGVSGGGKLVLDSVGSSIPAGTGLALANGSLDFNDLNLTVTSFTKAPAGSVDVIGDPGKTLTVQTSFLANQGSLNLAAIDSLIFNNPAGSFNAVTTANNGNAIVTGAFINNTITAATFGVANGGAGGTGYTSSASVALGDTNVINADTIAIGVNAAENGTATLKCDVNDASLTIRGTVGGTSRANMTVGYKKDSDYAGGSSTFEVSGTNSTLDAMLGTLVIGRHSTGAGNFNRATSGTFTFGEGTLDATSIQMGIGEAPNIKTANGTLTTAGGLIRTETLTLVQDSGGAIGTATVNIAGDGALEVTNITGQVATNAIVHVADTATVRNTPASNLTVTRTTFDVASTATAVLTIGSGNDAFFDASAFKFRYYSDTVAPDFGKLTVSGATILSDTSLTLVDENTSPADFTVGQKFVIIDYAAGSLSGTFNGLADGAMFSAGSQFFLIDYNDPAYGGKAVTLTVPNSATFEAWAAINAGSGGADDDFDSDGVANAIEYLMGQTGSTFTANPQVVDGKITWPKDAMAQANWVVQTSTNLAQEGQPGGWTNATVGVSDLGSSIEFSMPAGDTKFFVRLKVTVP